LNATSSQIDNIPKIKFFEFCGRDSIKKDIGGDVARRFITKAQFRAG
jgi:hypothetical protein